MNFDDYQKDAISTDVGGDDPIIRIARLALGVSDEAGEVAGKVKKMLRGDFELTDEKRAELAKEIGDVLWYCATLSDAVGYSLDTVARMNLDKLFDRKARGKIQGDGDNR